MALQSPFENEKEINPYTTAKYVKQIAKSLVAGGDDVRTRLKNEGPDAEENLGRFRALLSHYSKRDNLGKFRTKVCKKGWLWVKKLS